jgi:hypothetical protein
MQKIKRSMPLVAIIGILFATGIVFSQAFIAQKNQTKLGTPVALGEDESEDKDEVESKDEEDDKDEVDEKDSDENDDQEKDDEEEQKATVRTRATSGVQGTDTVRKQEVGDDENENEQENKGENEDENEGQGDLAELKSDISKVEANIAKLSQAGVSTEPFSAPLAEIKSLAAEAETKLATKADIEVLLETADKKLERLEKLVKIALGDKEDDGEEGKENDDEEEVAKTYKNSVAQFVHNLKELGEIEGGIGQQVKVVAQAQNDTQAKVEESISEVENRNGFLKFIVGPDYSGIANVQTAITENQTRIKVLSDLLNQITDPAVKLVLQGQVASLQQQNEKLQSFVNTSSEGASLFGWLVKLFQ